MKYLKLFNESFNDIPGDECILPFDEKKFTELEYDTNMIFADMIDDGIDIKIYLQHRHITIHIRNANFTSQNTTKLGKYSDSLYHYINYLKDEGFHISKFYLIAKEDLRKHKDVVDLNDPTYEILDEIISENNDNILLQLSMRFYPIK